MVTKIFIKTSGLKGFTSLLIACCFAFGFGMHEVNAATDCNDYAQSVEHSPGNLDNPSNALGAPDAQGAYFYEGSSGPYTRLVVDMGQTISAGQQICFLAKSSTGSSDLSTWSLTSGAPSSGSYALIQSLHINTTGYTEFCVTLTEDCRYFKITDDGAGPFYVDAIYYSATADWDLVELGSNESCKDACDGSILIDPNFNVTGDFTVSYDYNGNTITSGVMTGPEGRYLTDLCPGVYSNFTITGVHTGCSDVWPNDVIVGAANADCIDTPDDWFYECGDDVIVEKFGYNAKCRKTVAINIDNPSNVFQAVVEIVWKSNNPGASLVIEDQDGTTYTLFREQPAGGSPNVWIYRGVIPGNVSYVFYDVPDHIDCSLQSVVVQVFRNVVDAPANSGVFTNISGYNDIQNFSIAIPTNDVDRDLTIELPISELTPDGRYMKITVTSGTVTETLYIYGPDATLPGGDCCLAIPSLTLADVAGAATSIDIEIDTRNGQNGQGVNGQSWVISGSVVVELECTECITDGGIIEGDETFCAPYDPAPITSVAPGSGTGCPDIIIPEQCCDPGPGDKASQFTLKYTGESCAESDNSQGDIGSKWNCTGDAGGDNSVYIVVNDDEGSTGGNVYFAGNVSIGETFVASASNAGASEFPSRTYYHIFDAQGGTEIQLVEIHTSCSASVLTGDQFGSLVLVSAEFSNGFSCGTFQQGPTYFWQERTTGSWTTISGATGASYDPGFIDENTEYRRISTGCCQDDTSNVVSKLIDPTGAQSDGGIIGGDQSFCAPYDPDPITNIVPASGDGCPEILVEEEGCEQGDKPSRFIFKYTGNDCSLIASNPGNPDIECTGDPASDPLVYIVINDSENDLGGSVYFAGLVQLGDVFEAAASNAGETKFASSTYIHILDMQGGTELQLVTTHMSCSDPIRTGDYYGGLQLLLAEFENGFIAGEFQQGPSYFWQAKTMGDWMTIPGATGASYDPGFIDENTSYRRISTGCCQDDTSNVVVKTIDPVDIDGGLISGNEVFCEPYDASIIENVAEVSSDECPPVLTIESCCEDGNYVSGLTLVYTGEDCLASSNNQGDQGSKWDCSGDPDFAGSVYIVVNDDENNIDASTDIYFADNVTLGTPFTALASAAGQTKFSSNTYVHILDMEGGNELQLVRLHTSCSAPVVTGDQFGSITLITAEFENGFVCGSAQPQTSYEWISRPIGGNWTIITGANGSSYDPGLITETTEFIRIGTNCCGSDSSNVAIKYLSESNGGEIEGDASNCGAFDFSEIQSTESAVSQCVEITVEEECCDQSGFKPAQMTIQYTGEDCSSTTTNQNPDKWDCTGDPASDNLVYIIANNKDTPDDGSARVWFAGLVSLNETYVLDAANAGETRFSGDMRIHVLNQQGGTRIQYIKFHVSCSQPLAAGDQFGANLILNIISESGESCGEVVTQDTTITYSWEKMSGNGSWVLIPGATGESYDDGTISVTTKYRRISNSCCGIDTSNVVTHEILAEPTINAGPDVETCGQQTTTLTAVGSGGTPGYTYFWDNGLGAGASHDVSPEVTTTYTVEVTDSKGCTAQDAVTITVLPTPNVNAGPDVETCGQQTTTLTAVGSGGTPGYTYFWDNGLGAGASHDVSPEVTTTYTVEVTDSKGCTATDAVTITVLPTPNVNAGRDVETCGQQTTTITAVGSGGTPGYTYFWDNGLGAGASHDVSPEVTTTYTVEVTDSKGCTATDAVTITVLPTPNVNAGPDVETCGQQTTTLTAVGSGGTPGYTYFWDNGLGAGASHDVSPEVTTTYTVEVTDSKGCTATDAVTITVLPTPNVNAGPDVETCGQQTTTLTAVGSGGTPGYTYFWDNGLGAGASHDVSPEVTTTYTVEVTDSKGCTAQDAVTITVLPTPNVNAGPDVETCGQQTTTLTAVGSGGTPGYTYFWDNGLGAGAVQTVSPEVTTTYTVEITDSKGCTAQDAVTITVLPTPNVNAGPDVETCGQQTTTLTAVGSGGTPGYTYFWDNGLGAGAVQTVSPEVTTTYTVEITDSKGCTAQDAVTITVLPTPNVNAGPDVETCGQQTTTLTAVGSGGTPGYTYFWDNGLGAGAVQTVSPEVTTTYTVEITDSKGCTAQDAVTITVLPTPNVNAGPDVETCGQQTTTLTAVGSGGTPGYTYFWDNGLGAGAVQTVSPEVTTTYTVEVTDSKGCTAQDAVTITVLPTPNVNAGPDVETCGQQTTTLTAVGSGGTPGYTYFWDNGLGAGAVHDVSPEVTTTYTVEVTDSKGCTAQDAVTITVLPTPNVNAGPDVETCGQQTTTLTAVGSGGTPGYTYFWDNGLGAGASQTVSPEVTTTYTVEVTDSKGCTAQDAVTITVLPTPNVNAGPDVETCGQQTTTLTAVGSGGTPGYTYFWDNGLGAGAVQTVSPEVTTTYTVEVTDSKGCTAQDAVTITVLPTPNVNAGPDVETCGQQTTTLTAVGSGGTPGYTYFWDNGLGAGAVQTVSPEVTTTYTVEVTDSKGCTAQDAVTITVLPTPNVNAGPDVETCGQQTTTITAVGSGGTPGYTYFWDNGLGAGASQTVSPEVTTTYTVEVTDSKGCTAQDAVTITVLPTPNVNAGPDVETCGQQTTTITAVGSGGTPGYTYFWDNGLGAGASQTVSPEVTTTYTVEVTDSKGCTAQDAVTITVLPTPNVNAGPDVETCGQQTTTITAVGSGGTPGYTYFWDNGLGAGASQTVSPEVTTTYTVEVTDSKGCTAQDAVTITVLPTPNVNAGPDVETCGQQTTTLTAVGSGGTPGYTYFWDNGLGAGASQTVSPEVTTTYTVEVTDSKGCTAQDAVTITVLPTPNVNAGPDVETCGQQTTTITAVGSGGTPGYTYFWDNGLGAGASQTVSPEVTTTYTVEVTDSKGCTAQDAVTITVLPTPNVNAGPDVETCGQQTTTLTAVGSGGTPGYTYFWNNGLGAGAVQTVNPEITTTYTVEVTDSKGCSAQDQVTITVLDEPNVSVNKTDATCGFNNGTATATATGGNPPYSYSWSNGASTAAITGLATGTYTVTVTDNKGCIARETITISDLGGPTASAQGDEICAGETATISGSFTGGTQPVTIAWNTGETTSTIQVSPAQTTTYTFTATDANGCESSATATVTVNPNPVVNAGDDVETCGQQTTILTATTTGGTPGFTYFWNNGLGAGASQTVSPEVTTTYIVEVTDSKGCTSMDEVTVIVLPTPNVNAGPDVETCGQQTTTLTAVGSGGTPGYTYFWNNGLGAGASQTVSPEVTTTYTVEVTDSKGCTAQDQVTITVLPTPNVNAGPDVETCGQDQTTITAVGSGGTPGYTYFWDNGLGAGASQTVSPEVTTTYTVEVTDSKGCTAQDQVTIIVLPEPNVSVNSPEICEGESATLTASASGGTAPYTYAWNTGATTASITVSPAATTTYTVTVIDAKGCIANGNGTVTVNPNPNVNAGPDVETCGQDQTTLTAVGSGGTPGYTYFWNMGLGAGSTHIVSPEITTTYTVEVTDSKGCTSQDQVTVIVLDEPNVDAGPDLIICLGESAELSASANGGTPGYTFNWNQGLGAGATQTVTPTQTTVYTVTVTDSKGCIGTDQVRVVVSDDACTSLGDFVWEDLNANGIQDPNEPGVENVTVYLKDENGVIIDTTQTAADGSYLFGGLPAGTYSVQFELPVDFNFSPANQGGNDAEDSDADPNMNGMTQQVTLNDGDNNPTLDAGIYQDAALGNFVWEDLDGDGVQDPNEPGIEGVTVELKDENGNVIAVTTTGPNGEYEFTGLTPGEYSVVFVLPNGYDYTELNASGDEATDSDADPAMNGMTAPVTLESGETNNDLDAGLIQPASIGDVVFEDLDADGIQDDGEPGIEGVIVNLLDENGDQIATTTTGPDGEYEFTGLTPGDYTVEFETPNGFESSPQNQGGDDTVDSDANPANGQTGVINLESGENDPTNDAGFYQPASLGDFVWEDLDGDGVQDPNEPGIEGVTVELKDENGNVIAVTTTGPNGEYEFTGLTPGEYSVVFVLPNGYDYTELNASGDEATDSDADPAMNGMTAPVTLESGETNNDLDAGLIQPASIGDVVFEDLDADGIQDDGEPGIEGVIVNLLDENGDQIATTTTGPDGEYEFTGLTPGDYTVEFETPNGFESSPQNQGGDDTVDSDANPANGQTGVINLESGENDPTNDAGFYQPASLGDFVWEDLDGDGVQDPNEPGIEGVTVELKDENGNVIAVTTTGPNGEYEFTGLTPGEYSVVFVLPNGYDYTELNASGDEATDSDADPAMNGMTAPVTLESGETNNDLDAGLIQPASIGDVVFEDLDADGIQDDGEPGIEGVIVNLLDENGDQIATTTTGPDGEYEFTGLTPGDYTVEFETPNGFESSPQNQGGDDTVDSDANPANGQTGVINLESGENDPTNDAGFYQLASIGDFVFEDTDSDGIQDPGEDGVEGVTVYLLDNNGNYLDTTTTNANGFYEFTDLEPGTYVVEFELPAGFSFSPANQGGNDAADSDANPVNGQTGPITVTSGQNDDTNDAGLVTTCSVSASADPSPICAGASSTLTATPSGGLAPYSYEWSTGGTSQSITVTPAATTTYSVTLTDAVGCTSTASVTVTVNPNPIANAGPDVANCGQEETTLTATATGGTPGYTYFWNQGLGAGATHIVSPEITTTYIVEVTDANGCTDQDEVTVVVNPEPLIEAGATPATCGEANGTASAQGFGGMPPYSYSWSNGANTQTITGLTPGDYTVTVTDAKGCSAEQTVTVTNNGVIPPVPTGVQDVRACDDKPIPTLVVFVPNGFTADWYDAPAGGNLLAAGTTSYQPAAFGTYYVQTRDPINGCVSERIAIVVTPVDCEDCPTPDCLELEIER